MTYQDLYEQIVTSGILKVSFPYSYEEGEDLLDCYHRLFHQYIELLSQVDKNSLDSLTQETNDFLQAHNALPEREIDIIRDADEVAQATYECLRKYFDGFPSDAYYYYKDFLAEDGFYHLNGLPRLIFRPGQSFFRVRKAKGLSGQYGQLFHLPFELRSKASSERFSIPGFPSLYLSGSLITACMETNVNKEDVFAYSRLENIKRLEFIDLSIFNKTKVKDAWEYLSFFINYPLIMACHIPVKYPNNPFKPEYCIPQIITQIIRCTDEIDGIAYLSTKQTNSFESNFEKTNFILPTNNVCTKRGYCKSLVQSFSMTSPIEIPTSLSSEYLDLYINNDGFDILPLILAPGTCNAIELTFEN